MFVIGLFLPILHLVLTANALRRSLQEKFFVGIAGAAVRALFLVIGVYLSLAAKRFPGQDIPPSLAVPLLALSILGPFLSFSVLAVAWWRASRVPAIREQQASRPVNAWIAVATLDAILVVIAVGALLISTD